MTGKTCVTQNGRKTSRRLGCGEPEPQYPTSLKELVINSIHARFLNTYYCGVRMADAKLSDHGKDFRVVATLATPSEPS